MVAVAENVSAHGKASRAGSSMLALCTVMLASSVSAAGLPTGGQITLGSGNITQQGNTLLINQSSAKLATNWQSFSIGAGNTVQFIQPSATSIALNRVLGSDVSVIQGSLKANGQVFLLNPNGVLFTSGAQVNTSGLVASTLSLSDQQFSSGHYNFQGSSQSAVINQGNITTSNGRGVALIAAQVTNDGNITANNGSVIMASAQDVTLDMGGAVKLAINKGALDSLVSNGGAIQADGGSVLLTAKAADQLSSSVINNTGVIRAQTLASGEKGQIQLLGDMSTGTLNVGGTLDASAPNGGNGGAIETSAATVNTMSGLQVNAAARSGTAGSWLIDPYDYTIGSAAASTISNTLSGGTSVTVTTQNNDASFGSAGSSSGNGDITVNSAITDTGSATVGLTLQAARNITINSPITASNGKLNITLSAANSATGTTGGVKVNGNLNSNGGNILIGGAGGSLTSATSNGIGYALNYDANSPAVLLGTNVTLQSGGGNIVINGQTNATTSSYSGTQAGIYVLSGTTVNSQGGNIYMSGISTASAKEFGFGVEANSGTTTTFETSSTSGGIVVDARNTQDPLGALGLVNNGNQARVQFYAPNVAYFQFSINGSNQAATFTKKSPCNANYPNCGTMVIPGGNQSYTEAQYNVVDQAILPIYVFTGNGSKVYNGSTDASNVALTLLGGPNGFTPSALGALSFSTSSKNAGSYISLNGSASNPSSYQSDTYAVAYFNQGTYTITPKALTAFQATNKTYDGTTAAAVTSSGLVNGDNVQVVATGGFASANVGNNITVNVTGVSLSGTDAGNYTIPNSTSISTTANITPAALTVTANNASKTYDGLGYSGGNGVSYSGFVNGETSSVLGGSLSYGGTAQNAINAGSYSLLAQGLTSSNYAISYTAGSLTVNPATLTYTANSASRTYGASNPGFSGSVTGLVNNESLANVTTGTLSFGTTATSSSNVGSYAINGSGLTSNGNYVFAQAAGNSSALSITPAALSVTTSNASKTYDGLGYSGGNGVSYSGFVNGETSSVLGGSLSYGGTAQNAINAGNYSLLAQGLTSSNYAISYTAGSLTVNPATLTYTANSASRTYGASNPGFSGSVTGLVNNESLANVTTGTLSFGTTATSSSNVGSYAINGSGLTSNGNYVFVQAASNATALTITAAAPQSTPAPASTPADTEKYLPQTTTIPKFPDNAQQVLSNSAGTASFGGLNYVAVPELAANPTPASSTPPVTTTGISNQPVTDTASSQGQSSASSSGNQPLQTGGSSLNYVASKDGSSSANTGDGKKSANELNVNDVTVPSSTGPLDVHVVNGGINVATLFGGEQ